MGFFLPRSSLQIGELANVVACAYVARRIVDQISLVVVLGIPPLLRGKDFRLDLPTPPLLVGLGRDLPRNLLLLGIVEEDAAPILRADVVALLVMRGWVVHAIEELDQLSVADLLRVKSQLRRFGMPRSTRADGPVRGIVRVAANVSNSGIIEPLS